MVLSLRIDGDSRTADLAGQGGVYLDPVAVENKIGRQHRLRAGRKGKEGKERQGFHCGLPGVFSGKIGQPKAARQRVIWAQT